MTIFQIRATSFDGQTVPDENNFLITRRDIAGSDYWIVTDIQGNDFETIGAIPLRYLNKALPGPNAYLLSASFVPGSPDASIFTLGAVVDLEDGESDIWYPIGPTKTVNLAEEVRITNMYFGADYVMTIESDGAGSQAVLLDLGDISLQPIVSQVELGSSPSASEDSSPSGWLPWSLTTLVGAGELELNCTNRYNSGAGYAITIPVGEDNDLFAILEVDPTVENPVILTPSGGQTIQTITGGVDTTAPILWGTGFYAAWRLDADAGVWRLLIPQILF